MNAMTDQLGRQVKAGRRVMDRTLQMVEKQVGPAMKQVGPLIKQVGPVMGTRRGRVASAAVLAAVAAMGVGMLVYRRRKRRTLASRLQRVLPDELVARAGALKRALG